MTIPAAPAYSVTNPLSLTEVAPVSLTSLPLKVPQPDASGTGGVGVAEIPQPPTIVSPTCIPDGLALDIPITFLQLTPYRFKVFASPLEVSVRIARNGLHRGFGPIPTVGSVAGLRLSSPVTKKFDTVCVPLSMLPEALDTVIFKQVQPDTCEHCSTQGSTLHAPVESASPGSAAPIPVMFNVRVCVDGPAANAVPANNQTTPQTTPPNRFTTSSHLPLRRPPSGAVR
jgi:hypothetical protein